MKKRIIFALTSVVLILLLLLGISTSETSSGGNIIGTISSMGLKLAGGEEGGQLSGILGGIQNPSGFVTGLITQAVMEQITKQSPEAAQAAGLWNQIQPLVKSGKAKVNKDIKVSDKGECTEGELTAKEEVDMKSCKNGNIGKINKVKMSIQDGGKQFAFEATEDGGSVEIDGKKYENMAKGSKITSKGGEVTEADMTFTKDTKLELGGEQITAEKGMNIKYTKEKGIEAYKNKGEEFQTLIVDNNRVDIYSEKGVKITKELNGETTMTGEHFEVNGNDVKGGVTLTEKGYSIHENSELSSKQLIIKTGKEKVLYSNQCGDVSGFSSYVNPCKTKLTMQGEDFSVQLKEGKQFGLNVEKNDILKCEMNGGKATIEEGKLTAVTKEGEEIKLINGDVKTTFKVSDGKPQTLVNKDSVGKKPDVSMSAVHEDVITLYNEDTGVETFYMCPVSMAGTSAAITGAASAPSSLLEKCNSVVDMNTKKSNNMVCDQLFKDEYVTSVGSKMGPFERKDGTTYYSKIVKVVTPSGERIYTVYDDGRVSELYKDERGSYLDKNGNPLIEDKGLILDKQRTKELFSDISPGLKNANSVFEDNIIYKFKFAAKTEDGRTIYQLTDEKGNLYPVYMIDTDVDPKTGYPISEDITSQFKCVRYPDGKCVPVK